MEKDFDCFGCKHYDSYEYEYRFMDKCKIKAYQIIECSPFKVNKKGRPVMVKCEKKENEC